MHHVLHPVEIQTTAHVYIQIEEQPSFNPDLIKKERHIVHLVQLQSVLLEIVLENLGRVLLKLFKQLLITKVKIQDTTFKLF